MQTLHIDCLLKQKTKGWGMLQFALEKTLVIFVVEEANRKPVSGISGEDWPTCF